MLVKNRNKPRAPIPTGSMADIAFLLLIFFLVVTTISHDQGVDLILPPVGAFTRIPPANITNILINEAGRIMIDENPCLLNQIGDIAKIQRLRNDKMIFSVKAAPGGPYHVFIAVMDQLKTADVSKISLAEPDK